MSLPSRLFGLYKRAYSGLPGQAWVLFVVQLVNHAGSMVMFFLTLYLTRRLGYSLPAAGQVMSIYGIGSLVGAWGGGWFSDRGGALAVQKASLALSGTVYITLSFLQARPAVAVFVFLLAVGNGMIFPANNTAIARVCPGELRTKGFALNRLAVNLGVTVGPTLGGFLALVDYRLLFWVDGATCLAALVLLTRLYRDIPPAPVQGPAEPVVAADRSPWRDAPFLLLMLIVIGMGMVFVQLFSTYPIYLRSVYGFPEYRIGQLMAINTILIVTVEMAMLEALKKVSPQRLIPPALVLLGLGYALLPGGRGFLYAGFTVVVWTFGEMLALPLLATVISQRAGDRNQGKYMGLFSLAFSLAMIAGPAVGTLVYRHWGGHTLWLLCGGFGLLLGASFHSLARFLRPSEPAAGE